MSSSNKLSDLPITQVAKNETDSKTESDNKDKVIPSTHPPKASTSIQVLATIPTSIVPTLTRSSMHSRKYIRKFEL